MPEVTAVIGSLTRAGAVLTMTYNETDPLDPAPDLVRFNLTCTDNVFVRLWRGSQIPWREFTLPAGSYEYPAGGPVQKVSDITLVYLTSV